VPVLRERLKPEVVRFDVKVNQRKRLSVLVLAPSSADDWFCWDRGEFALGFGLGRIAGERRKREK